MQQKLLLAALGLGGWFLVGITLSLIGAAILNYSMVANTLSYGAMAGAILGLAVSLLALGGAAAARSQQIMLWILGGSILGAIVGFLTVVLLGGYPKGTQADLSFLILAPAGVAVGTLVGSAIGAAIGRPQN